MKRIIRLTEKDLTRIVRRVIKESEEEWIDQAQDMESDSDFSKMDLESIPEFQELVTFFQENPDIAQEIKSAMESKVNEGYKYYDYSDDRGKKEITRNQYLKRKLMNYGIWGTLGAIVGYMMGTMAGDEVLQAALLMAGMGGTVGAELSGMVGRERVKESMLGESDDDYKDRSMYDPYYGDDEEWGETDRGEQNLQDLLEEARDILENELGYSIDAINEMDEYDIVDDLHAHFYNELAYEIEHLLEKEGFADEDEPYDSIGGHSVNDLKKAFAKTKSKDEELDEGWDDFTQKKRYPKDYEPEKYRSIPKDFFRKNLGHKIDSEGTKLSRRREKPFDDYEDFDDEEYA